MEKLNSIIILKGSPGVGKTYTAKKLVSKLKNKKVALISIDQLLHLDTRSLNKDKLKLSKFHAALLVRSFLREHFDIIIEYTFDIPEHLEFMIEKMQHSHAEEIPKANIYVFHLAASLDEIIKRNKNRRDGSDPMAEDVLKDLCEECERTVGKIAGEVFLDTTNMAVGAVVDKIMKTIK
jgi:tRNA uridine 5-carbamoylmethylation protein Kti12